MPEIAALVVVLRIPVVGQFHLRVLIARVQVLNHGLRMDSFWNRNDNAYAFQPDGQGLQDIRAITLDLDDTLWAIGPVIRRAEQCLHDWYAEHYPRIVEQFDIPSMRALRDEVIAEYPGRNHDLTFIRCAVIEKLGAAAGYSDFPIDTAFAVFDDARNDVELFDDVRPALEALGRRYRLIALTNGNADLGKIGIDAWFDDCVSARSAGAAKPAAQIFHAAVAAAGVDPGQTLHVGDDPHLDVDGARKAGLRAIWVNRDDKPWPDALSAPDGEVSDLLALDRWLTDVAGRH